MTHHENLKIIIFIGPNGSGKSTAVHHFAEKGFPKIAVDSSDDKRAAEQTIDQVHHLASAGQHRIVIDDISSLEEYRVLKHTFPGEMTTVAISKENSRNANETADKGGSVADYSVVNDGSIEDLARKLDAIATERGFLT